MTEKMSFQTITKRGSRGELINSAVVNDADTEIPTFERDDPAPPSVTHQMICRPLAHCPARFGKPCCFFPHCRSVHIGGRAKPRPYCIRRMRQDRFEDL